jgi:hypothetical protein
VDGQEITTLTYDPAGDMLSYTSRSLSYSGHTVKTDVTDGDGNTNDQELEIQGGRVDLPRPLRTRP